MPLSRRCPPLPLLFVFLVSNCALLPTLFTPVAAPVPNHFHPVCARAVWSVHSLVAWASLCLGSPPLHGGNVPSAGKFFSYLFENSFFNFLIKLNLWLICVCMCVCVGGYECGCAYASVCQCVLWANQTQIKSNKLLSEINKTKILSFWKFIF